MHDMMVITIQWFIWSCTWPVDPFAKWCWGDFSLPLSYWVQKHAKSPRCLADTMPRFLLWAKIQYGRWRPLRKYNFFVFQAICKCSTSILTGIGVRNSFLILFWRLEVIFTFTGHVQGHLFMSLTMRITYISFKVVYCGYQWQWKLTN